MSLVASRGLIVWGGIAQRTGVGVLTGTLAGLVVGACARLAMRIVALVIGLTPGFTPGRTSTIVLIGTMIAVAPRMVYAVVERRLPGPPILKGLAFGVLLFVVLMVCPLITLASVSEPGIHPLWLRWVVFGALSVVYGVALGVAEPSVDRVLPAPRRELLHVIGYVLLALWGLATTAAFLASLAGAELGLGPVQ